MDGKVKTSRKYCRFGIPVKVQKKVDFEYSVSKIVGCFTVSLPLTWWHHMQRKVQSFLFHSFTTRFESRNRRRELNYFCFRSSKWGLGDCDLDGCDGTETFLTDVHYKWMVLLNRWEVENKRGSLSSWVFQKVIDGIRGRILFHFGNSRLTTDSSRSTKYVDKEALIKSIGGWRGKSLWTMMQFPPARVSVSFWLIGSWRIHKKGDNR